MMVFYEDILFLILLIMVFYEGIVKMWIKYEMEWEIWFEWFEVGICMSLIRNYKLLIYNIIIKIMYFWIWGKMKKSKVES